MTLTLFGKQFYLSKRFIAIVSAFILALLGKLTNEYVAAMGVYVAGDTVGKFAK